MRRVVITGVGAVTPLGNTFDKSWEALNYGRSGIGGISRFDVSGIPWKVAGELTDFCPDLFLGAKEIRRLDPFVHYAVAAALMAVGDAGLQPKRFEKEEGIKQPSEDRGYLAKGGVIIGSGRGGISTLEKSMAGLNGNRLSPYLMPSTTVSMAPSYVAMKLGMRGYCLGISNACASGAGAIGEAYRHLRSGFEGPVLSGGAEAPICKLCVRGYGASGALSAIPDPSASRPFDRSRDGFVLAEGACILVLEELDNALQRGASIYGEIIGYGNSVDAFHQTQPDPGGEAMAIANALHEAGVQPEDIDYISAHGTSTPLGDIAETRAIEQVFRSRTPEIPASAIKSMSGHMLGASGALEAAFTLRSMKEGIIPPTTNMRHKDPECCLNIITEKTKRDIRTAITNSFGFGGVNSVLVFKQYDHR